MRKWILVIAAYVQCASASAAEWEHIATIDSGGGTVSIDVTSIASGDSGYKKAWFKWIYAKPRPVGIAMDGNKAPMFQESLTLDLFNCRERKYGEMQAIYRDPNGEVVGSFSKQHAYQANWSEVAPETIGEMMLERVCRTWLPK